MFEYKYFIEHDYHVLKKATMIVRFFKISCGWIEDVREYSDRWKDKKEYFKVHKSNNDAFEAYLESMQSYGFNKFDVTSGKY